MLLFMRGAPPRAPRLKALASPRSGAKFGAIFAALGEICGLASARRMCRRMRSALFVLLLSLLAGCVGGPQQGSLRAHWPKAKELRSAASAAARSPRTWAPLTAAALFAATGVDDDLSDWLADERPLFGSDAARASDRMRDAAVAGYLLTALAVPSEGSSARLSALGVGIVALYGQGAVIGGGKELSARRRPDDSNHKSFPSGHAGTTSAAATLGRQHLAYIDMPPAARTALVFGFEGLAVGTAWARVEARKHYATDVLAGYALGHFTAAFLHKAFLETALPRSELVFQPIDGGGAIRLTLPLAGHRDY